MKYSSLVFLALSFIAAVLGFAILSGSPAVIFRILFMVSFIMATLGLVRPRKIKKPVRGSFATSFQSESEHA